MRDHKQNIQLDNCTIDANKRDGFEFLNNFAMLRRNAYVFKIHCMHFLLLFATDAQLCAFVIDDALIFIQFVL